MLEIVRAIGSRFSPESYLVWTRIEGSLWTLADFVIVFYLIRIANLARAYLGLRLHKGSYLALLATVPFALLLPFAATGQQFFRLELVVTIPHFLLILYVVVGDYRIGLRAYWKRMEAKTE